MDFESIIVSEISQTNTVCSHLHAESKRAELKETGSRIVVYKKKW